MPSFHHSVAVQPINVLVTSSLYVYGKTFLAIPFSRATATVATERKNGNGMVETRQKYVVEYLFLFPLLHLTVDPVNFQYFWPYVKDWTVWHCLGLFHLVPANIGAWSRANNLTLNESKSVEIIIRDNRKRRRPPSPPTLLSIASVTSLTRSSATAEKQRVSYPHGGGS